MAVDRSRLPSLGPEPTFTFPEVHRRTLPNGLRVWTVAHHEVAVTCVLLIMPVGASADPADRPGLAAITGDLLDEGSGDLSAMEVHEALGRLGAHIDTEVGTDATVLGVTMLSRFADRGIEILADMIIRPRLEQREFDRIRDLRLNRLVQLRDMPPALADRVFVQLLYKGHPYGHLPIGSEGSLRVMTLREVMAFHRRAYDPARATAIVVGDAPSEELAALVERAFGGWTVAAHEGGAAIPDPAAVPPPPATADRIAMVHRPAAAQSELRIGHVGVPRSTPDYHALLVLNMVLGGQFVSRLNMNLREEKGYTYGARTSFDFRRGSGPFLFQASVQSEVTADAVREALSELRAIRGDRPVTAHELEIGRAALTRGYPRNFETAEQIARAAAQLALYDLPEDYFTTFVARVLAVTEHDATVAASRHIDPAKLLTVIVGDREKVGPALHRLELGTASEVSVA
jgi:predicted Zn-dependent peptidase